MKGNDQDLDQARISVIPEDFNDSESKGTEEQNSSGSGNRQNGFQNNADLEHILSHFEYQPTYLNSGPRFDNATAKTQSQKDCQSKNLQKNEIDFEWKEVNRVDQIEVENYFRKKRKESISFLNFAIRLLNKIKHICAAFQSKGQGSTETVVTNHWGEQHQKIIDFVLLFGSEGEANQLKQTNLQDKGRSADQRTFQIIELMKQVLLDRNMKGFSVSEKNLKLDTIMKLENAMKSYCSCESFEGKSEKMESIWQLISQIDLKTF